MKNKTCVLVVMEGEIFCAAFSAGKKITSLYFYFDRNLANVILKDSRKIVLDSKKLLLLKKIVFLHLD
jgi:hypothetical protein